MNMDSADLPTRDPITGLCNWPDNFFNDVSGDTTTMPTRKHGSFHIAAIPKGTLGEFSKIKEEVLEAEDAIAQRNKVMELVELSDLVGAIDLYMEKHWPQIGLTGLIQMSSLCHSVIKERRTA